MALLYKQLNPAISQYRDRRFPGDQEQFEKALRESSDIYVGNLSFYTTEDQIYEVFNKAGDVKRIVMGLDKQRMTPCGFCFVSYYTRADAEDCVKYLNGTVLDGRPIRADFDWGFVEGRQFGRGRSGGQVRDEYRMDYDEGRGGYGTILQQEIGRQQAASNPQQDLMDMYSGEMGMGGMGGYTHQGGGDDGAGRRRFRDDSDDDDR